jgi:hypothetical protein
MKQQNVGGGGEPSIQEQIAALDRRWNELVYGPSPPLRPRPAVQDVLMVPVSPLFAAMAKTRPATVKVRLAAQDDDGVTRMEWPTGPVTLGEADCAIQRNGGKKDV